LRTYSYLKSEDKRLSSQLKTYQSMASKPYIISYLQGLGYKNIGVANVQVSYNNGNYMTILQQTNNFEPTSISFTQVGVSVSYISGMLEIFAAYI